MLPKEFSDAHKNGFQYRKRYGLHAMKMETSSAPIAPRFNTASGMDCMQLRERVRGWLMAVFQYRKRYGLHAMFKLLSDAGFYGMFQYRKRYGLHAISERSSCMNNYQFQYRKRYGLHAIQSLAGYGTL